MSGIYFVQTTALKIKVSTIGVLVFERKFSLSFLPLDLLLRLCPRGD
jgi:hypothetical protein